MSGNNVKCNKTSMAAELLSIISIEEYTTDITKFSSTNYLNKLELASIKKMVSGKLWLDSRRFVSRQNSAIVNGLFALFGFTLGKSAANIRAEACDFLLDADNVELRKLLRRSVNGSGRTYSKWIGKLSSDIYPCDEFGLFLLSFTFKLHVLVILADQLWCTFKTGRMSTFEKLCKADHVLVWIGDDRYCEVKPLQNKTGPSANIAEWQRLAESVDLLHSKSKNRARRVEKSTASVKTPTKLTIPSPVREPSKRDRKRSIDYKQLHEDGVYEEKKRRVVNYPPPSKGPSELRQEAQKQIVQHKKPTGYNDSRSTTATAARYVPLRTINVNDPASGRPKSIKQEHITIYPRRPVKPEPGIHMTHRVNPNDKERTWKFVHVSGRPCNQGGDRDCNSQSENEDNDDDPDNATLPDLPRIQDSILPHGNSHSDNITSPPAVQRRDFIPQRQKPKVSTNLGDLLCTLNFNVNVDTVPSATPDTRNVTTIPANNPLQYHPETENVPKDQNDFTVKNARTVATVNPIENDTITITDSDKSPHKDTPPKNRQVATEILARNEPQRQPSNTHTTATPIIPNDEKDTSADSVQKIRQDLVKW